MRDVALRRISESVSFEWPWAAPTGLAIISGAAGGGGGAFCMEGLNLFGAGGGGGKGYGEGCAGAIGADGFVVFLPLYCDTGPELCWT